MELEAAGMLPSSQEEAAGLAARIRLRGSGDAVTTILPEVSFSPVLPLPRVVLPYTILPYSSLPYHICHFLLLACPSHTIPLLFLPCVALAPHSPALMPNPTLPYLTVAPSWLRSS